MADEPISKTILDEMYNFIMAGISAGTAAVPGQAAVIISVGMSGVDTFKDVAMHPNENTYQRIGRITGDAVGAVLQLEIAKDVKTLSVETQAITAFGSSQTIAHSGLGDTFANLFNTYVANADAFYTKIASDADYAKSVWDGIVSNGLNNFVDYFDPDHNGVVSPADIVNGYKKLFSPPPAYGETNYLLEYNTQIPNKVTIVVPDDNLMLKSVMDEIAKYDQIEEFSLTNTQETMTITKTISPDTQKATYTLTASDLENASAIIGSVFGMIDSSAITPSDVVVNLTDTNTSTTLTKGNLLYELGTKGSIDLYSMLENNPWLIDESNIVLSNQHYELSGLESSISSLESALNSTDVSITEDASGKFSTIKANGNTFVITDHGQIIQYDVTTSQVFVVTGQYTESNYTIASTSPLSDELLGSIAQSLSTSSITTLPNNFDGVVTLTKEGSFNTITLSSLKNSDGVLVGTLKTFQEEGVQTITQSFNDTSLPVQTTVITDDFSATFSDNVFQGFSSVGNVAVSEGFNKLFLENLHVKELAVPSLEEIKQLNLNDTTNTNAIKEAYDTTVESSVSVTDYYGTPKLITQTEATLQTIGTGIASLTDALSLIKAIQSGQPLPIVATGIRLAADLDYIDGVRDMPNLAAASSIASGILSIMSLSHALENGDSIGSVTAGANALYFTASGYAVLSSSSTEVAKALSSTFETTGGALNSLGEALPYLSIVNSIANGDFVGAGVGVAAVVWEIPVIGWAYAVYSIIDSLFGGDEIPDPWGNGKYVWDGNGISYQSAGETGGNEAVRNVMSNVLAVLNNLIEQQRLTNPTSALGIIPNRMPTIAYDMSGYRYTDIDPLTGVEKHAYLRYDTQGNPYNATPGSDESYQSIIEAMVRSALTRSAIAPLWEVQTAKMQTLFTCKSFSSQKALHVKNRRTPKEANYGLYEKVA